MSTPAPPLHGLKVVEFAGLAPGPFAGLVLADWGAAVTRVDRVDQASTTDVLCRGKRSLAVDPKVPEGRGLLVKLISQADVLIDPFRPGVLEKLGLGPDVFLGPGALNNRLVYARIVGFKRTGHQKDMAGHDINYLAQSGVLSMLPGTAERPTFPLNLLADFGGGGLLCALGILLALLARTATGAGQVVHADMVSGARYLASFPLLHALAPASPLFGGPAARGTRVLDGGAPHYGVYTCADGRWMAVGCLEPRFFAAFTSRFVGALPAAFLAAQGGWRPAPDMCADPAQWPRLRAFLEAGFRTRARDEWGRVFHGSDACAVPVLTPDEAAAAATAPVPEPHPALTRTPAVPLPCTPQDTGVPRTPRTLRPGAHTAEILAELGLAAPERAALVGSGALGAAATTKL